MPRPIQAFIHTDALSHNLQRCRQAAGGARVWAVVKANAYGHGIGRVFDALRGADGFALLDLDEAQRLRDLGWRGPILLLEGVFEARDLELCSRLNLWHSVHGDAQIDMLAAHKTIAPHIVFAKVNTGMGRLGFSPARIRAAHARLQALPQVEDVGLMSHFAHADTRQPGVDAAWQIWQHCTADLAGPRTICNSAALLRRPDIATQTDWVRPGIALYGSSPDYPPRLLDNKAQTSDRGESSDGHTAAQWGLRPAMSLRSRIIAVQTLQAGESTGYGAQFTATQPTRIGIVACGYADGYPRTCPTGTPVLVDGQRSRLLGRVSMDMLAVDLSGTALAAAGMGSEVTLWGQASCGAVLSVDEVAHCAGTLGYELMCALAARVSVQTTL